MSRDRRSYDSTGHHLDRPESTSTTTHHTPHTTSTETTTTNTIASLSFFQAVAQLNWNRNTLLLFVQWPCSGLFSRFQGSCLSSFCSRTLLRRAYIPCSAKLPGSTTPFYICTTLCFFLCRADVSWYLGTRAGAGGPRARHQSCISRSGRSCAPAKALPRSVTNAFLIAASLVQTQPLAALCLNHRLKPKVWKKSLTCCKGSSTLKHLKNSRARLKVLGCMLISHAELLSVYQMARDALGGL